MSTITTRFEGLDALTRKLREVGAASRSVFREAAEAGAHVVQRHAIANAPGPHIGVEIEVESGTKATASIGPLKHKWFYRFREFGTKAHKAKKGRGKRSFYSYLKKIGRSDLAATEPVPVMAWKQGGQSIFARKVRGVSAKPFLQPAIQRTDEIVDAVGAVYLRAIKEKTG